MASSPGIRRAPALLLLFLVFALLAVSDASAGASRKLMEEVPTVRFGMVREGTKRVIFRKKAVEIRRKTAHPRNLRVKMNDYSRYDPAPALEKPPFKLIPN